MECLLLTEKFGKNLLKQKTVTDFIKRSESKHEVLNC